MNTRSRYILKWSSIITGSSFISYTFYQYSEASKFLRKPLNTKCLFGNRSEWIYIKHNYLREPVRDLLNELFEEETKIYSFLYNLKKRLTFSKVSMKRPKTEVTLKSFLPDLFFSHIYLLITLSSFIA
jgi:hypothetical protein